MTDSAQLPAAGPPDIGDTSDTGDLSDRLDRLSLILKEGSGQLDRRTRAATERLLRRAGQRLRLSGDHTVVALAGGTGTGKSTLFNALSGLELSGTGARRPTTSAPYACVWGPDPATELLDWLEIAEDRRVLRESELDADSEADLRGLVLLDMPDFDSIEVSHRVEVDRLLELVDELVWVLDPQKYADTTVHDLYLKKLRAYSEVMIVVLNQADRLDPGQAQSCLEDLRRMLADDGLAGLRSILTSARTGVGVPDLRAVLTSAVASHQATAGRIAADIDSLAPRLVKAALPLVHIDGVVPEKAAASVAFVELTGVEQIGAAAAADYRALGLRRVGWPPLAWRHRREPGVPPLAVSRADLADVARKLAGDASAGLDGQWPARVESRAIEASGSLADGLDEAIHAAVRQRVQSRRWWRAAAVVQWLLVGLVLAGAAWSVRVYLTTGRHWPLAGWVLAGVAVSGGALLLGPCLGWFFGRLVIRGAARRRRTVTDQLKPEVAGLTEQRLLVPLRNELATYNSVQDALRSFAADTAAARPTSAPDEEAGETAPNREAAITP